MDGTTEGARPANEDADVPSAQPIEAEAKGNDETTAIDGEQPETLPPGHGDVSKLSESIAPAPISMSAGADPWADPPAYDRGAALHDSRRATRENPWAEAEAREELADGGKDDLQEDSGIPRHRDSVTSTGSSSLAKERPAMLTNSSQDALHSNTVHDEQRYTLLQDDRADEYDLPKLGKPIARYWMFKKGHLQLNSGAYGSCPRPVMEAFNSFEERQEENCDAFRRYAMENLLTEGRRRVASVLNADSDDVVLISNATTGTNAVLRDITYASGDAILTTSVMYPAVANNVDYLIDMEAARGVDLCQVKLDIPCSASNDEILSLFRSTIDNAQKAGKRVRVAIIDVVASKPALLLPWKGMVAIAREKQVLSLVDGAHGIGHIPIDLREVDPDFFVSNCHKWLYAHRSCAVFYVPKRNRHIQKSSLPTSFFYTRNPSPEHNTWLQQWTAPGTVDVAPLLSVSAALDFRGKLGGEARILNYNHDLAVRGGWEMARVLGTEVMDVTPDGAQTGAMTNVRLPIIASRLFGGAAQPTDEAEAQAVAARWAARSDEWFFSSLLNEFKTCIPTYAYGGKIWGRVAAQVFLDMDDFTYGARALRQLCERINQGDAPDFSDASQR